MKSIVVLAMTAISLAAIQWSGASPVPGTSSVPDGQQFIVQFAGDAGECEVRKGGQLTPRMQQLEVGDGCRGSDPLMQRVAAWVDNGDGTVTFAASDGSALIDFMPSDGAVYETFRPGAPLALLVERD